MSAMSFTLSNNSALYPSPSGSAASLADSVLQTPEGSNANLAHPHATNMSHVFLSKDGQLLNSGGELLRPAREDGLLGSPAVFGHSLASALDFNAVSLLGKRQMQAPNDPAMFRHSIQPLLASDSSSQSFSSFEDSRDDSNSTGGASFDISAFSHQTTDFLMSPPRMTVHLPENTPSSVILTEEAKRRRTAAVQQTPLQFRSSTSSESIASGRSNPYLGGSAGGDQLLQQTPQKQQQSQQPWMNMQERSGFFYSVTETPSDISGSMSAYSSQPSSVGSSYNAAKIRRLSLAADENSDIASLTLGLTLPNTQDCTAKSSSGSVSPFPTQESSDELCSSIDDADACDSPTKSGSTEQAPDSPDPSKNKAGNVWPDNVEVAFWEALRLIPKLGRRKVLVGGKACGRNELIADYIHRKTGVKRSRKQVSSHIQVLKNIKKTDVEFQQLISEPKSDDEYYIPAGGMMYAQTLAGYGYGGLGGQYPLLEMDGIALLSPYTPSGAPDLMAPPLSATTSLTSAMNGMSLPTAGAAEVKTATCNSFPILPSSFTMWLLCSQTASRHDYVAMDRKKMTSCAQGRLGLPMMPIENIRVGHLRFPMLAEMYQRLPCQFLHVHVPLHVPRFDVANPRYDQFSAQLSLVSTTDARLTSVTTIYSHGKRVLSLVEPLDPPRKIISRSGSETGSAISGANTPATEAPPPTANSSTDGQTTTATTNKHNFVHQAPFATDFWADFLSRTHPAHIEKSSPPAFGKDPCERAALGMAISGITLVQEFVVASEETINNLGGVEAILGGTGPNAFDPATSVSAGSKIGDVVLVVAWDLECVEALEGPGATSVSLLTMQNRSPSPLRQANQLPEVTAASPYKSSQMLTVPNVGTPGSSHQQHSFSLPNLTVHGASPSSSESMMNTLPMSASEPLNLGNAAQMPTLLRKRGLSVNKPNLMVQIPPAPAHLSMHKNVLQTQAVMRGTPLGSPGVTSASHAATQFGMMQQRDLNTPITPFPQLIHTPDVPPPLLPNVEEAAFQRERLQRHWATVGPPSDLTSPLNPTFDLGGHGLPAQASSQMLLLRANSLSSTLAGAADIRSDSMSSLSQMSEGGGAGGSSSSSSSSALSPHSFPHHHQHQVIGKRPSLAAAPFCQRSLSTGALGLDLGISSSLGKAHEIDGQMIQGISSGALEAHQQSASDFSHSSSHDIFEGILAALGASPGGLINSLDDVEN